MTDMERLGMLQAAADERVVVGASSFPTSSPYARVSQQGWTDEWPSNEAYERGPGHVAPLGAWLRSL